jgi:signal transduction histidine kinase/ActR/RegA family two-component response regulator
MWGVRTDMLDFRDMSIRRKLTLLIMLTSIVVLLLASTAFLVNDRITFRNSMVNDLEALARVIGTNSSAALVFNDPKAAAETLSALSAKPHVVMAAIHDVDGQVLAYYTRKGESAGPPSVIFKGWKVEFAGGNIFIAQPVMLDKAVIGSVSLQYDLEEMNTRIKSYIGIAFAIMLVASVVAFLIATGLQGFISAPILKLAETARLISREKRYSLRADKYGHDEVGTLIDGFNEMLSQIQERDVKLEGQRESLEEQVTQRTAELRRANEELMSEMKERNRTEDELLRARRLESIGLLAGGIAHDFNNLLTAILGNISLAKMFIDPSHKVSGRLAEAEKACTRAKDLTRQLLTFSKGGAPIKRTVSIKELLIDSASFALSGSNVKCEFDLPADIRPIEVDEGQISQVINNVIINADHAMREGGLIRVRARNITVAPTDGFPLRNGNYVQISVEDHGNGISAEYLPKIFDPYFTTKPKGSGLGLATCYSIIKRHEGLITVESEVGVGTTFYIYLPASAETTNLDKGATDGPAHGNGRVLLMDDEEIIRKVAGQMLSHLGYEVVTAADGHEAINRYVEARAEGRPFGAVIIDLTVPGAMGGKEAIQKLTELDPGIRAIVSSGYSQDPIMSEFRKFGFCGMVAKPYKIEDLSRAVREAIMSDAGFGDYNIGSSLHGSPPIVGG